MKSVSPTSPSSFSLFSPSNHLLTSPCRRLESETVTKPLHLCGLFAFKSINHQQRSNRTNQNKITHTHTHTHSVAQGKGGPLKEQVITERTSVKHNLNCRVAKKCCE